jgi:hypothetical protein
MLGRCSRRPFDELERKSAVCVFEVVSEMNER